MKKILMQWIALGLVLSVHAAEPKRVPPAVPLAACDPLPVGQYATEVVQKNRLVLRTGFPRGKTLAVTDRFSTRKDACRASCA